MLNILLTPFSASCLSSLDILPISMPIPDCFWNRLSLPCPGCPGTHRDLPASVSPTLGLKACAPKPSHHALIFNWILMFSFCFSSLYILDTNPLPDAEIVRFPFMGYRENYEFFPSYLYILYFLHYKSLIALAKTSNTALNRNREDGHPCIVPDFCGNALSSSLCVWYWLWVYCMFCIM